MTSALKIEVSSVVTTQMLQSSSSSSSSLPYDTICKYGPGCSIASCKYSHGPKPNHYRDNYHTKLYQLLNFRRKSEKSYKEELFNFISTCDVKRYGAQTYDTGWSTMNTILSINWFGCNFDFSQMFKSPVISFLQIVEIPFGLFRQPPNFVDPFLRNYHLEKIIVTTYDPLSNEDTIIFLINNYRNACFGRKYFMESTSNCKIAFILNGVTRNKSKDRRFYRRVFRQILNVAVNDSDTDLLDCMGENKIGSDLRFPLDSEITHVDVFDRLNQYYPHLLSNTVISQVLDHFRFSVDILQRLLLIGKFNAELFHDDETLKEYVISHGDNESAEFVEANCTSFF